MWLNVKLIHILGWADWRDPTPPPDATLGWAGGYPSLHAEPVAEPGDAPYPLPPLRLGFLPFSPWLMRASDSSANSSLWERLLRSSIDRHWDWVRERERWRQPWQHLTPVLPASAHPQQQHQAHANRWAHIRRPSCWEAAAAAALRWSPVWAAEWPAKSTLQRVEWCLCGRKGDAASGCPEGNRTASRCLRCPTWKAMTPPSLSCSFEPKM